MLPLHRTVVRFELFALFGLVAAAGAALPAHAADAVLPRQFGTMYPDPPYQFHEVRSIVVRFKTAPEVLRRLVPEPVVPNREGAMWLFAGRQRSTTLGDYNEVILGVPARFGEKAGSFLVTMYLDETVPIVVGRERGGWPKKDARVELVEKDGVVTAVVTRGGKTLVRAAAKLAEPMNPAALDKVTPTWFMLKEIPSAKPGAPPEVLQLVGVTPRNRRTRSAVSAHATLELGGSPADPLDGIPVLEVSGATLSVVDQDLPGGEILHDYLGKAATASTAARP